MGDSWITRHPSWYVSERELLARHYPTLRVDEATLAQGNLVLYGELEVRPPGGTERIPICMAYPQGTPYEPPTIVPLERVPEWSEETRSVTRVPEPRLFSARHQMPDGNLCLFQRETRGTPGGEQLDAVAVLRRAERWFVGLRTNRWPPDTAESELETHFHPVGDVLVADVFFDPELGRYGQFYFVPDLRRLADCDITDFPPRIITCMSKEDGVIRLFDARQDLSELFSWIASDIWDAARQVAREAPGPDDRDRLERGLWWQLDEEPVPIRNGAELLGLLRCHAHIEEPWRHVHERLGGEVGAKILNFGFRFPSRSGGLEWLFVSMLLGERRLAGAAVLESEAELRDRFEAGRLVCMRVARLTRETLRFRNSGVVDEAVCDKSVAFIGLGALGGYVAELIVKAGVNHVRLCDLGRLEIGNVARHVGGLDRFGERKTTVVARRLLAINPYLVFSEIDIVPWSAVGDIERLRQFMADADVTVCTTADEAVESVVNEIAIRDRRTVVYGRSLRRGSLGRTFLVRPGTDACKACLAGYMSMKRRDEDAPAELIDVPDDDEPLLHECGRPVIAGSGIDLSFESAIVARVTLDVLEGQAGGTNHWVWSRSGDDNIDERVANPLSTYCSMILPDATCPICQEPEVREVVLPGAIRTQIEEECRSSPDGETGGVLIGRVEGHRATVTRATGPGPGAERRATIFRRDVEFTQAELDKAAEELGGDGLYIGEWHSHLVPSTVPSATDIESLVGIAEAPHYLTRCPVMLICGVDVPNDVIAEISAWSIPIGGRVYGIPLIDDVTE